MKGAYESVPLGLRLSHVALLRNLERFIALADDEHPPASDQLPEFVALYVDFLEIHHLGEDEFIFPALRRHAAGKSTDVAQLETWSAEHREVHTMALSLSRAAKRLQGSAREGLIELRRVSVDLKDLLVPHLASEEAALTSDHLRAMIPEEELQSAQRGIGKKMGTRGLSMGAFLAHSLAPREQQAMFGEQPWIVRKVLFGFVGERQIARFRPFLFEPTLAF